MGIEQQIPNWFGHGTAFLQRYIRYSSMRLILLILFQSNYVMLCYVMLICYVMLCYVVLYVMLCHVMLCYVMLCHVMSCYVML